MTAALARTTLNLGRHALAAARDRGRRGGRPRRMTAAKLRVARRMREADPPESYGVIAASSA